MGRGQGSVTDMLVFAMLVSVACSLLLASTPRVGITDAYGASVTRATLQALQHATVDEFGGIAYSPTLLPKRELHHKTFVQLLLEDALLNLGVEVDGLIITPKLNSELDRRVRELLQNALERALAGRFGYRLVTKISPESLGGMRVAFEISIESARRGFGRGWSETAIYNLPLDFGGGVRLVALELTLTLWPR